jgi:hypothetical protein
MEQGPGVGSALHSSPRYDFGRDALKNAFHTTDLLYGVHLVVFGDTTTGLTRHDPRVGNGFSLLLQP